MVILRVNNLTMHITCRGGCSGMQILLLQKRQFKISADVIISHTYFVVSTYTFLSLIFNVLVKHDHIREKWAS